MELREEISNLLGAQSHLEDGPSGRVRLSNFTEEQIEEITNRLFILFEETGYVKLASDQNTPQYNSDFLSEFDAKRAESNFTDVLYDFGIQVTKDLLKAGWRKIGI